MSKMVKVKVSTDDEVYPAFSLWETPDSGVEIPVALFKKFQRAQTALEQVQNEIVNDLKSRYPNQVWE